MVNTGFCKAFFLFMLNFWGHLEYLKKCLYHIANVVSGTQYSPGLQVIQNRTPIRARCCSFSSLPQKLEGKGEREWVKQQFLVSVPLWSQDTDKIPTRVMELINASRC